MYILDLLCEMYLILLSYWFFLNSTIERKLSFVNSTSFINKFELSRLCAFSDMIG